MAIDLHHIITQCQKADRKAQQELYTLLAPKLYGTCLRYTNASTDAEDLLQEAFMKIFSNISSFKADGHIEAWARRITVNVILEAFRKKKMLEYSIDYVDHGNLLSNNSINVLESLSLQELTKIINSLPEGKRVVFNLYVIEGYSHKEIAEMLNISEGTSKSQLSKAKEMLAEILKPRMSSNQ